MSVVDRDFPTFDQLAQGLATEIMDRLSRGVEQRGNAGLMLTGGGTPAPVYEALATRDGPWAKVEVTLSDERWVDVTDPGSNEGLVRRTLMTGPAGAARLIGLKTADSAPSEAQTAVNSAIEAMPRPFEVVLLGMGEDGHVASLFPHAPELASALDERSAGFVQSVHQPGAAGAAQRLSMTRRAMLDARWIVVLLHGEEKREVYRRAKAGDDIAEMPIRMILNQHTAPVEVWWAP